MATHLDTGTRPTPYLWVENDRPKDTSRSPSGDERRSINLVPPSQENGSTNSVLPEEIAESARPIPSQGEWQIKGYPKLARMLSIFPEAAVFRRFGNLGMLNLLSLQAELIDIETRLGDTWEDDDTSSVSEVREYTSDFYRLHRSKQPFDDQLELLNESRQKLGRYCRWKYPK